MARTLATLLLLSAIAPCLAQRQDEPSAPSQPDLKKLLRELRDDDNKTHRLAEQKINALGAAAIEAVPELFAAAVQHQHKTGKRFSARGIHRAVVQQGGPLETLEKFTRHGDRDVRAWSYNVLEELGPKALPVLPQLVKTVESPDVAMRPKAVRVIGAIGPPAKEAIPVLIKALEKPPTWAYAVAP